MKRWYWIFDPDKCLGCFNCFHACKDEFVGNDFPPLSVAQPLHQNLWLTTTEMVRGQHPMVDVAYLTEPCNHCEDAPCVKSGAAYRRSDGIVILNPKKAVGDLTKICPFGKIAYNRELNISQKCTFCAHLLDDPLAQPRIPRCVQACPVDALGCVLLEPEEMAARAKADGLQVVDSDREKCGSAFYVKNLYRYNSLFAGGTVTDSTQKRALKGCDVELYREDNCIQCTKTDAYGDFKFDNLEKGEYTIHICIDGYISREEHFALEDSCYIGIFPMKEID